MNRLNPLCRWVPTKADSVRRLLGRTNGREDGFTLLELMIVTLLVTILAAVAYPAYREQAEKSRRTDATAALVLMGQFMERFGTANGRFDQDRAGNAVALPIVRSPIDGNDIFYNIGFVAGSLTTTAYTLQAVPVNAQANDPCGTLTLDQSGMKGESGAHTDVQFCWK